MHNETPITKQALQELFGESVVSLRLELVRVSEPRKDVESARWVVYFAARCECGVAAMITIEVMADRSYEQVHQALPGLHQHLASRAKAFYAMPCQVHQRMGRPESRP